MQEIYYLMTKTAAGKGPKGPMTSCSFINDLKESKARRKDLALGWIDYKKAYDMIPHPWILERLGLVGTA